MTDEILNSANALKADINKITGLQGKTALAGARVQIIVTNANSTEVLIDSQKLVDALGSNAYDTICTTALGSINTALNGAKTTKQSSYTALTTS